MAEIVREDGIRSGQPRLSGTRITVLDVKRRVIDNEEDPHVVAGEYEISMTALFAALTYYYDNREEFDDQERKRAATRRDGEHQTRELLEQADSTSSNHAD